MPDKLRILLADDHKVVRAGLKALIEAQEDMSVVAEASDGEEACRLACELVPDVAILDVSMPRLSGADAAERIKTTHPEVRVLALTLHEDHSYLHRLLDAGASGYLLKLAAAEDLIHALRTVSRGGTYLDPGLTGSLLSKLTARRVQAGPSRNQDLSDREEEVLRLISRGFTNREIAAQLDLSVKTVETHRARAMDKINVESRAQIVKYAITRGWLAEQ